MANSTIPGLVAVTVPAGTDLLGVRQSGDARDKKLTVTQLLSLAPGGGDVFKVGTPVDDQLPVWTGDGTIEGSTNFNVVGTLFRSALGNGPGIVNLNGVNILPRHGDPNTGLQNVGDDRLAMVAGGVAGITLIEASSGVLPTLQTNVGITAFATGGQTSATQLNSGYNVVDTVATTGDSVKFSSLVNVGSLVYVKNDGANALDLFPAGGDDLGLGVGVAISVAAGKSVAFLGSVLSSTWTQLIFEEVAGGGDVTKVGTPVNNQVGVWTGDGTLEGDTGLTFDSVNGLLINATGGILMSASASPGNIGFAAASTPMLLNEGGTGTNPNIVPNKSDLDTGLGLTALDQLSIIAGGVEIARAIEAANDQFAVISGIAAAPGMSFISDLDTGFYPPVANVISVALAGVQKWSFTADRLQAAGSAGAIGSITPTSTQPSLFVNATDPNTGIGANAVDQLSLIAGGVELLRISDDAGAFILAGTNAAADGGDLDLSSGDSGVGATGDGGAINIAAGESLATAGDGGALTIKSGAGFFTGAGGDILVEVGEGGAAGPGTSGNLFINTLTGANAAAGLQVPVPGLVSIYGIGRSGEGAAGNLELWGGYAAGTGGASAGGDVIIWGGGQGGGSGVGGGARLIGGESEDNPGDVEIRGGQATVGGIGGDALVNGGAGFTNSSGGGVVIRGGIGAGTGNGGQSNLIGGQSGNGATGNGGNVEVVAGASVATNGDGGDAVLGAGAGSGGGGVGEIQLKLGAGIQYRIDVAGLHGEVSSGPVLRNVGASSIIPNLIPNRTDTDTGIGQTSADILSLIAGAVEGLTIAESGGVITLTFRGDLQAAGGGGAGPVMRNVSASPSVPTIIPNQADPDTGLTRDSINGVSMVGGGLGCIRGRNIGGARAVGFYTTTPIIQQTGVAVTDVAIHAALVALGLITA